MVDADIGIDGFHKGNCGPDQLGPSCCPPWSTYFNLQGIPEFINTFMVSRAIDGELAWNIAGTLLRKRKEGHKEGFLLTFKGQRESIEWRSIGGTTLCVKLCNNGVDTVKITILTQEVKTVLWVWKVMGRTWQGAGDRVRMNWQVAWESQSKK